MTTDKSLISSHIILVAVSTSRSPSAAPVGDMIPADFHEVPCFLQSIFSLRSRQTVKLLKPSRLDLPMNRVRQALSLFPFYPTQCATEHSAVYHIIQRSVATSYVVATVQTLPGLRD